MPDYRKEYNKLLRKIRKRMEFEREKRTHYGRRRWTTHENILYL